MFLMDLDEGAGDFRPVDALHRRLVLAHDVDFEAALAQARRRLHADETRPQNDDAARRLRRIDDGAGVGERAQHMRLRPLGAGKIRPARRGSGRQQQPVVANFAPVREPRDMPAAIERGDLRLKLDPDAALVERFGAEADARIVPGAFEEVLGQLRAFIGRRGILRYQRHAALDAFAAEHVGRRETGAAAADDDEGFLARRRARLFRPLARLRLRQANLAVLDTNDIAPDRRECGRRGRLACLKIEAGLMPRAAHLVARPVVEEQALMQRPAEMRAGPAKDVEAVAAPEQDKLPVVECPLDQPAFGDRVDADLTIEIERVGLALRRHFDHPFWREQLAR